MAHYGFLPDSEVPTGRINPYIGVGPAIVWTGVQIRLTLPTGLDSLFANMLAILP